MNTAINIFGMIIAVIGMAWLYRETRPVKFVDMVRFHCNELALKKWRDEYDPIPLEMKIGSEFHHLNFRGSNE